MQGESFGQKEKKAKTKYAMSLYAIRPQPSNIREQCFTPSRRIQTCVCQYRDSRVLTCFKCINEVHYCLNKKLKNRGDKYECHQCLNLSLDPIYQVRKVYVSSFFETSNIFKTTNNITFQFTVNVQDKKYPIEVRGLVPHSTNLAWPMHGAFFINDEEIPFYDIRPLMSNSNRKSRREQYFPVPEESIVVGKNCIRFTIYKFDKAKFTARYQYEQTGVYFLSINSIKIFRQDELINDTFKRRKYSKKDSLSFLHKNFVDIEITSEKLSLVCPYTKVRIKFPVRGKYCKHFNCVCLSTLIATHFSGRFWNCPICEQKLNEPYVDTWMLQMLEDGTEGTDVIIRPNGSYQWIKKQKEKVFQVIDESEDQVQQDTKVQNTHIKMQDWIQDHQQMKPIKSIVKSQRHQSINLQLTPEQININQYEKAKMLLQGLFQITGSLQKKRKRKMDINDEEIEMNKEEVPKMKKQIRQNVQQNRMRNKDLQLAESKQLNNISKAIINLQDDQEQNNQQVEIAKRISRQKIHQAQTKEILLKKTQKEPLDMPQDLIKVKQWGKSVRQRPLVMKKLQKQPQTIIITDIKILKCQKLKEDDLKKELRSQKSKLLKDHQLFLYKPRNNVHNLFKDLAR